MKKGLASSLTHLQSALGKATQGGALVSVRLDQLKSYGGQLRTNFDNTSLAELADSITAHGVQQAILVRPTDDGQYEIIAGERRWRASKLANRTDIPAIVKHVSDEEAQAIHRLENTHRENLSTHDIVEGIKADLAVLKTHAAVAARWNKSKAWVSKMLSLATLGDTALALVEGNVTSDIEVLTTISAIEKKDKQKAKEIADKVRSAPSKANVRSIVRGKTQPVSARAATSQSSSTRTWPSSEPVPRKNGISPVVAVTINPECGLAKEFHGHVAKYGEGTIATDVRHRKPHFVWVRFGARKLADYHGSDLTLVSVK